MASAICLRLLTHWDRRAASRAACTAGSSRAIRTAMMAITTSNSIRVNPRRLLMDLILDVKGDGVTGAPFRADPRTATTAKRRRGPGRRAKHGGRGDHERAN